MSKNCLVGNVYVVNFGIKRNWILPLFYLHLPNRFYCREKHFFFRSKSDFRLQVCLHIKVGNWFVYTVTIMETIKK